MGNAFQLSNSQLSVSATLDYGLPTSLFDVPTGDELTSLRKAAPIFRLTLASSIVAGETVVSSWGAAPAIEEGVGANGLRWARVLFSNVAGRGVDVVCRVLADPNDPFIRWGIQVDLPPKLILLAVEYPMFSLDLARTRRGGDALVVGSASGGVYRDPSAWKSGRVMQLEQPGQLAAQLACLYNPVVGLVTAALDHRGHPKAVRVERTTAGLIVSWIQRTSAQTRYASPYDLGCASFRAPRGRGSTEWYDGAEIYRSWAVGQRWCARRLSERRDLPAWLASGPAIVRFDRSWLADPGATSTWLSDYWARRFPPEVPLITAFEGWERYGAAGSGDRSPVFPSEEELARLLTLGRSLGCHALFVLAGYEYPLSYRRLGFLRFALDFTTSFNATARAHAVRDRGNGVRILERSWLQGGGSAPLCPADAWTVAWIEGIARSLLSRGAEIIQLSHMAEGPLAECHAADHGHPLGPGAWWTEALRAGLSAFVRASQDAAAAALAGLDAPNEHLLDIAPLFEYARSEPPEEDDREPAAVFDYLYHGYGVTYRRFCEGEGMPKLAHSIVCGRMPALTLSRQQLRGGSILYNGGFEEWSAEGPSGWDRLWSDGLGALDGGVFRDRAERQEGASCLRLENHEESERSRLVQEVAVGPTLVPGRQYRVRLWLKTQGVQRVNRLALATFGRCAQPLGTCEIEVPPGSGDWEQLSRPFKLPRGAAKLRLTIGLEGAGSLWLDGLHLEAIDSDGKGSLVGAPEPPVDEELFRRWIELYHGRGCRFLMHGRLERPPILVVAEVFVGRKRFPAVFHSMFSAPDGSLAVILVNITDEVQSGRLLLPPGSEPLRLAPHELKLIELSHEAEGL